MANGRCQCVHTYFGYIRRSRDSFAGYFCWCSAAAVDVVFFFFFTSLGARGEINVRLNGSDWTEEKFPSAKTTSILFVFFFWSSMKFCRELADLKTLFKNVGLLIEKGYVIDDMH